MRNMVRILAAGALVGCFAGGLAFAADSASPTFKLTAPERVSPGEVFTVQLNLLNAQNVGALKFQMQVTGGIVKNIVVEKESPNFVFTGQTINAVDSSEPMKMRAGAVKMDGGNDVVNGVVATIEIQAGKRIGEIQVSLANDPNQTFLRNASAVPITGFVVESAVVGVGQARPTAVKARKSGR